MSLVLTVYQMVQAIIFHMGQQSRMPTLSFAYHRPRHDGTNARGERLWCFAS